MFLDEINSYSVDWVKQIAHILVALTQSVKGRSRTKMWPSPGKREFLPPSPVLGLEPPSIDTGVICFYGSPSFQLPWNYSIGSPGSRVQILELPSLYNHVSHFLIVNLCMSYVCISYWFCSSGEHWLIQGTSLPLILFPQHFGPLVLPTLSAPGPRLRESAEPRLRSPPCIAPRKLSRQEDEQL